MGTTYNSIDDKNRMIVPAKLRAELGSRCILTKGLDQCLYIYALSDWEKQVRKAAELPESDPGVRAFIRHFFGDAEECEFDKQGRVIIPQSLKAYAGIGRELVTIGAVSKIEIWAKEILEDPDRGYSMDRETFAAALKEYRF